MLALILNICLKAGELDYRRFFDLPEHVQSTWLEHERNLWQEAYRSDPAGRQGMAEAMRNDREAVKALRRRGAR